MTLCQVARRRGRGGARGTGILGLQPQLLPSLQEPFTHSPQPLLLTDHEQLRLDVAVVHCIRDLSKVLRQERVQKLLVVGPEVPPTLSQQQLPHPLAVHWAAPRLAPISVLSIPKRDAHGHGQIGRAHV